MEDVEKQLEEFELPGKFLHEISVNLSTESIESGLPSFDSGRYFRKGQPDLFVLAARPGVGKTSLGCQIAYNISKTYPVLMFSLEMSEEQIKKRFLAYETNKPLNRLQYVTPRDLDRANDAIRTSRLIVDDENGLDINTMISRAISYHKKYDLALVVVDYLQIIQINKTFQNEKDRVGQITEKLKTLAKELSRPVIAIAQMNRDIDKRDLNSKPSLSDLADSKSIEAWADYVAFLKPKLLDDGTKTGDVNVYILKSRHEEPREFTLGFSGALSKFFDNGDVL